MVFQNATALPFGADQMKKVETEVSSWTQGGNGSAVPSACRSIWRGVPNWCGPLAPIVARTANNLRSLQSSFERNNRTVALPSSAMAPRGNLDRKPSKRGSNWPALQARG